MRHTPQVHHHQVWIGLTHRPSLHGIMDSLSEQPVTTVFGQIFECVGLLMVETEQHSEVRLMLERELEVTMTYRTHPLE